MKIRIFILAVGLLLSSCAERYSTRKRTVIDYKSNSKKTVAKKNISKKEPEIKYVAPKPKVVPKQKTQISHVEPSSQSSTTHHVSDSSAMTTNSSQKVLDTAFSYLGTPYRYGGTTRSGMDCSGFVSTVYKTVDVPLSRSSSDMANQGKSVNLENIQVGDLLFFVTGRTSRISHVGIVVEVGNEVKFIHASTSRGVIVSSLSEGYWSKAYRKAKRVM